MSSGPGEVVARYVNGVRTVNRWLHVVAGAVLLLILAITIVNILQRRFAVPLAGTVEMTATLMTVVVFLGIPHSEDEGDHISVDLVYERMGDGVQKAMRIFARLVGLLIMAAMTRQLWEYAGIQDRGGYTTTVREWPIHPFVRVAALGALMLTLATLANLLVDVFGLDGPDGSSNDLDNKGEGHAVTAERS